MKNGKKAFAWKNDGKKKMKKMAGGLGQGYLTVDFLCDQQR